jgi:predicted ester cyclase
MSTDENKAIVDRYFDERWNRKNHAVIDDLLGGSMDLEDARETFETVHAAIKDLEITINDLIADGDQVVVRWTIAGIHQGELKGVAPSGQPISWQGLSRVRLADGKIISDEHFSDLLEVLTGTS